MFDDMIPEAERLRKKELKREKMLAKEIEARMAVGQAEEGEKLAGEEVNPKAEQQGVRISEEKVAKRAEEI
jgi:hypothetical protein